jgi:hypothetical protein
VRLGGQQLRVQVGGYAAVAGWAAELGAVGGFTLAEQQVIRFALDPLAMVEAQCFGAGAPPASRRFTSALAGLDVIAGRVLDWAVCVPRISSAVVTSRVALLAVRPR